MSWNIDRENQHDCWWSRKHQQRSNKAFPLNVWLLCPRRLGKRQNRMSTCKQTMKQIALVCLSLVIRRYPKQKRAGKLCKMIICFPRWADLPFILHFSGVTTVTLHSSSSSSNTHCRGNTSYPFMTCKLKWTADPLYTTKYFPFRSYLEDTCDGGCLYRRRWAQFGRVVRSSLTASKGGDDVTVVMMHP